MDKVLLVQENDSVVIVTPIDQNIESLAASIPGSKIVDKNSLPSREWRDAWTIDGTVNLEKAKKIWQKKVRRARDVKLKKLDIDWMQAMERGDIKIAASIAASKQVLRDLPEREEITKAESLQALQAFWPSILED